MLEALGSNHSTTKNLKSYIYITNINADLLSFKLESILPRLRPLPSSLRDLGKLVRILVKPDGQSSRA
jgi:hypothetical protein